MKKKDYVNLCRSLKTEGSHQLSREILRVVRDFRSNNGKKLPVIWIETNDSGDNNISFMNTTYPYLDQVFEDIIDLYYSNTFMAAQGEDAYQILKKVALREKREFTLVVEGAIPLKANGRYNITFITDEGPVTAVELVRWLGELAKYAVAVGTCASFGGASAASPNITGSVALGDVLDRQIINVSGCPINPDWFVGTLAHLQMYGLPDLDRLGRPELFYQFTVHRHCQRRSYFDDGNFAEELGDIECMFSQGCVGPRTGADCPYRLWDNHVSYPIKVNTPCIGCTNEDFPDGSSPFFVPLPLKRQEDEEVTPGRDGDKINGFKDSKDTCGDDTDG
ncbi:hydrogenase small subunit [Halothermothrix orenii]|uniref:Hydrogenase (NiFe) small subunit HydA n=1 Tax=Halothermothrix orenii (strain H 168 / OCM 544 / DSM 9562) TaxID=373903 RepID=B8D1R7_HALOH|nr:hydrogenase small subunit [Halothermothrix orenii]ACL69144.1 hydrogenase (NiFe) small subunit HydA [Halothermothrix orenii H 168]